MTSVGDLILKAQHVSFYRESTSSTCGWNAVRKRWKSLTSWWNGIERELGRWCQKHSLLSWPMWSCCFAVFPCLCSFLASFVLLPFLSLDLNFHYVLHPALWISTMKEIPGHWFYTNNPWHQQRTHTSDDWKCCQALKNQCQAGRPLSSHSNTHLCHGSFPHYTRGWRIIRPLASLVSGCCPHHKY